MTRDEFIEAYGGIYEHSPWVAADAFDSAGRVPDIGELRSALAAAVDRADTARQLALVRAHPDLAGRAAIRGELTADSTSEQASAGIDQCTPAEFERFQELNEAYKAKFGFPFVMAVRKSNRREILQAFAVRLDNDYDDEFATAIAEIHKIAALRLEAAH
ncbi:MAG: 2-oxo-4-hydroxy-4-carboxy-5-ureidoimidazoline decarboxylase [Gammaproteobacteria bacterium]|nr:2-oxo-4-hydroxy-4-carboxy-5-ureidoimidazoline decarboxylase [Gammaproteobacteria bacterium]